MKANPRALVKAMKEYDFSIRETAKLLGVNPTSIINWKEGIKTMSPENRENLQHFLDTMEQVPIKYGYSQTIIKKLVFALKDVGVWKGWNDEDFWEWLWARGIDNQFSLDHTKKLN